LGVFSAESRSGSGSIKIILSPANGYFFPFGRQQDHRMKTTIRSVNYPSPSGHRVITVSAPGVAAPKALQRKPATLQRAVLLNSLHSIGAAGRRVAATRSQQRRYGQLIKAYERGKQYGQQFLHPVVVDSVVGGGGVNWRSSLSVAVVMACSTVAYSGSAASVNSRNTCSCMPAGTTGGSRCLRCRQASTIRRRTRWRSTLFLNFFLGTEKPACTAATGAGAASGRGAATGVRWYTRRIGKTENAFPKRKSVLICCSRLSRSYLLKV